MCVASLNMNGFGHLKADHPDNKWSRMYRMMKEHRIAILFLQETHLTESRTDSIHKMFGRKIKVFHSANPEAPTQREGVAIVLNSKYMNVSDGSVREIVPGRAMQLDLKCQGDYTRHMLCIYAPTSEGVEERRNFFSQLKNFYESHPSCPKPDLLAGDFNNVEDAVDRLPISEGPDASILALDDLKLTLGLMVADGWRTTYPHAREYTFHRGSGPAAISSRLDRIYVSPRLFDHARDWKISTTGVKTDHQLVSVQLTSDKAPVVGPGRPIFALHLLNDKKLTAAVKQRGLEAIHELTNLEASGVRTADMNPQRILQNFKTDTMSMARKREREVVPKLLAEI
ncbi:DNase I-like protein, partial [Lentinus tigrinus ALCF2SS1-7]|uniref:DNase I-like protein n=1 Tax=Lentinus tigrinus ALCF2SS1-7 TaxID=1328758 RepID=UPI001165C941